ncbi:hypothetical protein M1D79_02365 [Enterobacter sp. SA24]
MSYTPHQLNLITKTILKLMPTIAFCSSSVAFAATITAPGVLDDTDTSYNIESETSIDINLSTKPTLNINDGFITSVINEGTIENSAGTAIDINKMKGELTNKGIIDGNTYAINIINGSSINVNNYEKGKISGTENAIVASDNFAADNKGIISSTNGSAIEITSGSATIINSAVISSENDAGIALKGNGSSSISNAGTIHGNQYAIKFESSEQNSLVLQSGSNLEGDVLSTKSLKNKLILEGSGTENSNFIGFHEDDGFASLNMRGEAWTLSGNIDLLGNGSQKINDKVLQVTTGTLTLTGNHEQCWRHHY